MRLIIAATLFAFAFLIAPANAAKPLPPEVRSAIKENSQFCDKKIKYTTGFLTRRDVNGDGIDDFILDYGGWTCDGSSGFCGSGGCLTQIFASTSGKFPKVFDDNVHNIKFITLRGKPAIVLEMHGSFCGLTGAEACSSTFYWDATKKKFLPVKSTRR